MVAQEDRTLNLGDRMALRLHLAMCKACPRFQAQMLNMRNSFKAWRNYSERD